MRHIVTDVLDLAGLLLLVAAAVVSVWPWSVPAAVLLAGVGLLGISYLIDHRSRGAE